MVTFCNNWGLHVIRKVVLPTLLAVFLTALFILVWNAKKNPATLTTVLSGMISAASGVSTIVLAYWIFQRERGNRQRDENEKAAIKAESQKRLAGSCAATISEWLNRRDLNDIVRRAGTIPDYDSIKAQLRLSIIAKRGASHAQGAQHYWQPEVQILEGALQVSAFEGLSQVPNIWTDGLNREKFERLASDAAEQLGTMATIWANLVLISTELSPAINRIDQLRADEADLLPTVGHEIHGRVIEFRSQLEEFLKLANETAELLPNHSEGEMARNANPARELLNRTRAPSGWFEDAWRVIVLMRAGGEVRNVSNYVKEQATDLAAGAERQEQEHKKLIESLKMPQEPEASDPSV